MSVHPHLDDGRTRLSLQMAGGMIGPVTVKLPGRESIDVLTCPDWAKRDTGKQWLPLIRNLCGDFVCVPYGAPTPNDGLPAEWLAGVKPSEPDDPWFHGEAANADWQLIDQSEADNSLTMGIALAEPHLLARVERTVRLLPDVAGYEVDLCLTARRDTELPVALHPCFRLPEKPGDLHLSIEAAGKGWTYPVSPVEETAMAEPNARFETLAGVPAIVGNAIDFSSLPTEGRTEALLQIPLAKGQVNLGYINDGYRVVFAWDEKLLPSVVLWVSQQGRDEAPFSRTFRTLGVEAVAGAFDLGPHVSRSADNPMAREGVATTVKLTARQTFKTTYRVLVEAI